ncbi:MAG TPA: OmpA family protein [Rudaea sp.]
MRAPAHRAAPRFGVTCVLPDRFESQTSAIRGRGDPVVIVVTADRIICCIPGARAGLFTRLPMLCLSFEPSLTFREIHHEDLLRIARDPTAFARCAARPGRRSERLRRLQRPFVVIVESKAMEAGMVTVAASALDQSLMSTGKAVVYGIYFDFDKSDVQPESAAQLQEIATLLNKHGDLKRAITGHTDNQGDADYNQKLSRRRADAIVAALTGNYAIAANRLSAQGLGSSSPVANNDTDEGCTKSRRVERVRK